MASRQDSLQHLLSCVVCLEEFEEDGDHIPRLLPCTHTLCEICVKQLIRNNKIECPECRAKHEAPREEKSFPQNKYLLIQVKRKSGNEGKLQPDREKKELCTEHRKELILFCNEPECKKPICLVCLKKSHKKHDVTDIVDEKRDVLKKKIRYIEKNLREKISGLTTAKCEVSRKTEACLGNLEKRREEIIEEIDNQFEKMKKETKDQLKETNSSIENEVTALNENLNLLSTIKQNTDVDDDNDGNYSDMIDMIETVEGVKEMVNQSLSGKRTYSYPEFLTAPVSFGNIVATTYDMKLPQIEEDAMLMETNLRNITDTAKLKYTVTKSFDTDLETIGPVHLLGDGSLAFNGNKKGQEKLKCYKFDTGTEISCADLPDVPWGCCLVELGGRPSLALSFGEQFIIEFRDVRNLDQILYTHSVAPKEPGRLCQVSTSVLLHVHGTLVKPKFHWVDCSTIPPKENSQKNIIFPAEIVFWDMCFVKEEAKCSDGLLIVTPRGPQGIHAYNVETNSLQWKREIEGMARAGVAPDGHGHLFVFDGDNGCIHMLSVSDGHYMRCLIKQGDQGLGAPFFGVLSEEMSSLIVAHGKGNKRFISVIKVQLK